MKNVEEDVSQKIQDTDEPMDFESPTPLFHVGAQYHIERKSEETEELKIEDDQATEEVKSGDIEQVDLEGTADQGAGVDAEIQRTSFQGTARQFTITPRTLVFEEDQAGPSMPIVQERSSSASGDDETIAEMLINMSKPRGVIIQEPEQVPQTSSTSSQAPDPKDKGKGILVEPKKKKKMTLR